MNITFLIISIIITTNIYGMESQQTTISKKRKRTPPFLKLYEIKNDKEEIAHILSRLLPISDSSSGREVKYNLAEQFNNLDDINAKRGPRQWTLLMAACWLKHSELMNILLKFNADVTIQDNIKATALHYLCASRVDAKGELAIVKYYMKKMVERGANVNALDIQQQSPLLFAAKHYSSSVIEELINNGAQVNQANTQGITPLMLTVQNVDIRKVVLLIKRGALLNTQDVWGRTALMYLPKCTKGLLEVAKELVEAGADVNILDRNGNSILSHILKINNEDLRRQKFLKLFIKHGALVQQEHYSMESFEILEKAQREVELDKLRKGRKHLKLEDLLFESVQAGDIYNINFILHSGVNVNAKDGNGWTPLMYAAHLRNGQIYVLLWQSGADPLLQNNDGITAEEILQNDTLQI